MEPLKYNLKQTVFWSIGEPLGAPYTSVEPRGRFRVWQPNPPYFCSDTEPDCVLMPPTFLTKSVGAPSLKIPGYPPRNSFSTFFAESVGLCKKKGLQQVNFDNPTYVWGGIYTSPNSGGVEITFPADLQGPLA